MTSAQAVSQSSLQASVNSLTVDAGATASFTVHGVETPLTTPVTVTSTVSRYVRVSSVSSPDSGNVTVVVQGIAAGTASIKVHVARGFADLVLPVKVTTPTLQVTDLSTVLSNTNSTFTLTSSLGVIPSSSQAVVSSNNTTVLTVTRDASIENNRVDVSVHGLKAGTARVTVRLTGHASLTFTVTVSNPTLTASPSSIVLLPGETQYVDVTSALAPLDVAAIAGMRQSTTSTSLSVRKVSSTLDNSARFQITTTAAVSATITFSLVNYVNARTTVEIPSLTVASPSVNIWQTGDLSINISSDDPAFQNGQLRATFVEGKNSSAIVFQSKVISMSNGVGTFVVSAPANDAFADVISTQFVVAGVNSAILPVVQTVVIRKPTLQFNVPNVQLVAGNNARVTVTSQDLPIAPGAVVVVSSATPLSVDVGVPGRDHSVEIRGIKAANKLVAVNFEIAGYVSAILYVSVTTTAEVPLQPVIKTAPTLTGLGKTGSRLSLSNGTWTGSSFYSFTYKWYRCSTSASRATSSIPDTCSLIANQGDNHYVIVKEDKGKFIRGYVMATNLAGSASLATKSTGIISK